MSEELKPCPFCGGEAKELDPPVSGYWMGLWRIRCTECGATINGAYRGTNREAWNRRAERTCNVESSHVEQEIGDYSYLEVELSCGHAFTWDDGTPPDYCPHCGAKVVDE